MTHEQKPESAEFRTREDQIETMTVHYMEAGFPINAARSLARDGVAEAEARGAAEQRRKDADGAKPVGYVGPNLMERFRQSKALFAREAVVPKKDKIHTEALYTRPANVAALIAEAVAAERERCANKMDEIAKRLSRPWGSHLTEEGIAVKEACAARVEQEAAAIREGGEHG